MCCQKDARVTRGSYAAVQQRPDSDTLVSPVTPPTAEVFQLNGFHCMYRQERGIACIAQSEKHFREFLFVLADLFLKTVLTVFTMSHLKQVCRGSTHFFYIKKGDRCPRSETEHIIPFFSAADYRVLLVIGAVSRPMLWCWICWEWGGGYTRCLEGICLLPGLHNS